MWPPRTPAGTTLHKALSQLRAAPRQCSAAAMATPSSIRVTGRPLVIAEIRATREDSRQPAMLTGLTVPRAVFTGPALPMPTATTAGHPGSGLSFFFSTPAAVAMTVVASPPTGADGNVWVQTPPVAPTSDPAIFAPDIQRGYQRTGRAVREDMHRAGLEIRHDSGNELALPKGSMGCSRLPGVESVPGIGPFKEAAPSGGAASSSDDSASEVRPSAPLLNGSRRPIGTRAEDRRRRTRRAAKGRSSDLRRESRPWPGGNAILVRPTVCQQQARRPAAGSLD